MCTGECCTPTSATPVAAATAPRQPRRAARPHRGGNAAADQGRATAVALLLPFTAALRTNGAKKPAATRVKADDKGGTFSSSSSHSLMIAAVTAASAGPAVIMIGGSASPFRSSSWRACRLQHTDYLSSDNRLARYHSTLIAPPEAKVASCPACVKPPPAIRSSPTQSLLPFSDVAADNSP